MRKKQALCVCFFMLKIAMLLRFRLYSVKDKGMKLGPQPLGEKEYSIDRYGQQALHPHQRECDLVGREKFRVTKESTCHNGEYPVCGWLYWPPSIYGLPRKGCHWGWDPVQGIECLQMADKGSRYVGLLADPSRETEWEYEICPDWMTCSMSMCHISI